MGRTPEKKLKSLNDKRKAHIEQVLGMTGHDLVQAADLLRISMAELKRWMRKLEILACNERTDARHRSAAVGN